MWADSAKLKYSGRIQTQDQPGFFQNVFSFLFAKGPPALFRAICLQRTVALVFCYWFANNCFCLRIIMDLVFFFHLRLLTCFPILHKFTCVTGRRQEPTVKLFFMYSHLIFLVSRKADTMLADGHT